MSRVSYIHTLHEIDINPLFFRRVYQLELLEFQETGDATPQGVVLALIGAEVESQGSLRERDVLRSIRMYNLSSLTSLARWAKTQKA